MKTFKGHSRKFYLHIEPIDFPNGIDNESDSDELFKLIKSLNKYLTPFILREIACWCMSKIKEHQENNPAKVHWYENALKEINNG